MKLADVDKICEDCPYKGETTVCSSCRIGNAPEVDAVPVVRCKDCKQIYENVSGIYCRQHSVEVEPYYYCADGDRGDTNETD